MSDKLLSLHYELVSKEKGTVRKDWGGKLSIVLIYPNHYHIGMSNLGFQVVYGLFNRWDHIVAERAFLPEEQEMSLHLEGGKGLFSLESQSPLQKFDIIAFSISFENDYPNILKILQMGKIPLLREDRGDIYPLIMAGGITSFLNPEPLADFFDLFLLGEAEANLNDFIPLLKEMMDTPLSRQEVIERIAGRIKSAYVPSLYRIEYDENGTILSRSPSIEGIPATIDVLHCMKTDLPVNRSTILTPQTEFADKILIELGRGCGRSCRFCAAGYVYRPPRVHEEEDLQTCVANSLGECKQLGLLSASVLDTPGIDNIARVILEKGGTFSISSLRADLLNDTILEYLNKAGQKTVAIAPEAGSERLRRVINKHLTTKHILEAVKKVARSGRFALRLYFMIGLPTETKEDVSSIPELVKAIKHCMVKESKDRGKIGLIRLSVNCFIPKAFTPFQWFPMESVSSLKEKQKWLKKAFSKEGGVKISFDVPKWAYIQALLSLGDRRVGKILMLSHRFNNDWIRTFRYSDLNPDFFVHRSKETDEILPWDFINHGLRKEFLIKEYTLALKGKESETCNVGKCTRCGVCNARHSK